MNCLFRAAIGNASGSTFKGRSYQLFSGQLVGIVSFLLLFFLPQLLWPVNNCKSTEPGQYTICGHIRDATNGEELLGATLYIKELRRGTSTNKYGFYSISLEPGTYTLEYSYLGYKKQEKRITLTENTRLNVTLQPKNELLESVTVSGRRSDANVNSTQMSRVKMESKDIAKIPALMGEIDVIKTIQLLPGVQSAGEGSTGFSVRGGSRDQNLVLLDEATVFNASHLMGFFSVFNNDAIKEVELYKGDIPARHGGRLSSLVDIRQKDGNMKKIQARGGIGSISSRLTIEGPVIKDKTSFVAAGRRSYADIFLPLAENENLHDNTLYFYDLNFKVNHILNDNNRFYISQYYGRDIIEVSSANDEPFSMSWGNITTTARWNHLFSDKLFSNFTFVRSGYDYNLGIEESDDNIASFKWISNLEDNTLKADFGYYLNLDNTIRFGGSASFQSFSPGKVEGLNEESVIGEVDVPGSNALSYALYASNEQEIGALLSLNYGLRYSVFQNMGESTVYEFDENFSKLDSSTYNKGEIFNTYDGFEPRISLKYTLNQKSSLKASYSRTMQYLHLASNATVGTPLDVWMPSSPNIKPQSAHQGAIGYFRNFFDNALETSVELYYKKMNHQIDFKDHAQIFLNPEIEGEMRFGQAEAYGTELLIRKVKGPFTGWISYTYSHAKRYFEDINNGKPYLSPFNRTHDISLVMNYDLNKRFSSALTWVFATGNPVTFPTGRWEYGNMVAPVYTDRNTYRMPDYHRMDLSIIYTTKNKERENKRFYSSWNLSVYNVYDRHNAFSISFRDVEGAEYQKEAIKTYLFGIIPSI
ncbi:MAG: TonB-dependent receptor, partial [Bacteroidales bacterium]